MSQGVSEGPSCSPCFEIFAAFCAHAQCKQQGCQNVPWGLSGAACEIQSWKIGDEPYLAGQEGALLASQLSYVARALPSSPLLVHGRRVRQVTWGGEPSSAPVSDTGPCVPG